MKKTILHTIDTTGPGGAETVFIDLATRLSPKHYRPVVAIRGKGWVHDELKRRGVSPVVIDAKGSFNYTYLKNLVSLIKREKVDIIQSHLLGANVYCSMAGLLSRVPVVATFHGKVDIGDKERFKKLKFSVINRGASCVVAVADSLRESIIERMHLQSPKIKTIYNGIETSAFMRAKADVVRRKYGWSDDVVIVGLLGNIRPAKGYDVLLQVAHLSKKNDAKFRFVIAGDASKKSVTLNQLLELREALGLNEIVRFFGFVDDPSEYLASIDIFLSTSNSEGMPLSAIQAMAAGAPVVATDCGDYNVLLKGGRNGMLVQVGNAPALYEAIEKLYSDDSLREGLVVRAREWVVAEYDISTMLESYHKLYTSCLW